MQLPSYNLLFDFEPLLRQFSGVNFNLNIGIKHLDSFEKELESIRKAEEKKLYMYHYCPKYIRENTKCNALGVFLIWLLMFVIIPVYYLLWFGYWLCHVGRQ